MNENKTKVYPVESRHSLETGTLGTFATCSIKSRRLIQLSREVGEMMNEVITLGLFFATRLSRMISEDLTQQVVATLLELVDHSVVQGILVLFQPVGNIVGHLIYPTK